MSTPPLPSMPKPLQSTMKFRGLKPPALSRAERRNLKRPTYRWTSLDDVIRGAKLPLDVTKKVLGLVVAEIVRRCWAGERIRVEGLGIFEVASRKARTIPHPITGEPLDIPRSRYLVLRHPAPKKEKR